MPAEDGDVFKPGKLARHGVGEPLTLGGGVDAQPRLLYGGEGIKNGLGKHEHACAAAEGVIIGVFVLKGGEIADVYNVDCKPSLALRPAYYGAGEGGQTFRGKTVSRLIVTDLLLHEHFRLYGYAAFIGAYIGYKGVHYRYKQLAVFGINGKTSLAPGFSTSVRVPISPPCSSTTRQPMRSTIK